MEITVEQAQKIRDNAAKQTELANALGRLMDNEDFKKVFMVEYIEKEPQRLCLLLAEPAFNFSDNKKFNRDDIQERLIGVARFHEFFNTVRNRATMALKELDALNKAETEAEKE